MPIFRPSSTVEYSILDPVRSSLDDDIISGDEVNPNILSKILEVVENIKQHYSIEVDKVWWVGSSLTYQWQEDSDIDITLFVSKDYSEYLKELNTDVYKTFNEKLYIKQHPVHFYFSTGAGFQADTIYDVMKDKWIKKPKQVDESEIAEIISHCSDFKEFNEIMKLYVELQSMLEHYNGSRGQLEGIIDQTVDVLVLFEKIRQMRRDDFSKKPNKSLPSANYECSNIVYKLLERFGLQSLSETVSSVLQQGLDN